MARCSRLWRSRRFSRRWRGRRSTTTSPSGSPDTCTSARSASIRMPSSRRSTITHARAKRRAATRPSRCTRAKRASRRLSWHRTWMWTRLRGGSINRPLPSYFRRLGTPPRGSIFLIFRKDRRRSSDGSFCRFPVLINIRQRMPAAVNAQRFH